MRRSALLLVALAVTAPSSSVSRAARLPGVGLHSAGIGAVQAAAARPKRIAPALAAPRMPGYRAIAGLRPSRAHLGERVLYEGMVIVEPGVRVRWVPPQSDSGWTWGPPRAWRRVGEDGSRARGRVLAETVHVEVPLQAFTLGVLSVPGLAFQLADPRSGARGLGRLPVVRLNVEPLIPASDTSAQLRPLRGPLAAPWWERVPWRWVLAALALIALAILLWRWLARRRWTRCSVRSPSWTRCAPSTCRSSRGSASMPST